jgi:hypothetical protein
VRLIIRNRILYIKRERRDPPEINYRNLESSVFYGGVLFDTSETRVPSRRDLESSVFYGDVIFDTSDNSAPFRKIFKEATFSQSILAVNEPSLKVFVPVEIESSLNSTATVEVDLEIAQDLEVVYDCGVWMGKDFEEWDGDFEDVSASVAAESSVQSLIKTLVNVAATMNSVAESETVIWRPKDVSSDLELQSSFDSAIFFPVDVKAEMASTMEKESQLISDNIFESSLNSAAESEAVIWRPKDASANLDAASEIDVVIWRPKDVSSEIDLQAGVDTNLIYDANLISLNNSEFKLTAILTALGPQPEPS